MPTPHNLKANEKVNFLPDLSVGKYLDPGMDRISNSEKKYKSRRLRRGEGGAVTFVMGVIIAKDIKNINKLYPHNKCTPNLSK